MYERCDSMSVELEDIFNLYKKGDVYILGDREARNVTLEQKCLMRQTKALEGAATAQLRSAIANEETARKTGEILECVKSLKQSSVHDYVSALLQPDIPDIQVSSF